jgi:DNA-binding transcriptional ArsR family regulator
MYDDQGKRKMGREEYAHSHPVRARILALYATDEHRSLLAKDLLRELADENTSYSALVYHLRILKDSGLLPKDG